MSGKPKEGIDQPTSSWFKAADKLHASDYMDNIEKELADRSDLVELLADSVESFIYWAGYQRLSFLPNLEQEVADFMSRKLGERKRMYQVNVKEWLRITAEVFKRDGYVCQYCGKKGGILECDHKIPFSKGGSDELENLVTACRKCNRRKKDRTYEQFIQSL